MTRNSSFAMTIADNVLVGIRSVADLQKLEIPAGQDELPLIYAEGAEEKFILRKCSKAGGVTDEPMPKSAFVKIHKSGDKCRVPLRALSSRHTARSG